jgi:hypothetical protein
VYDLHCGLGRVFQNHPTTRRPLPIRFYAQLGEQLPADLPYQLPPYVRRFLVANPWPMDAHSLKRAASGAESLQMQFAHAADDGCPVFRSAFQRS